MSSNSFAIAKSATAKLKMKMKMLPAVSLWLSVTPTSSLAIDTVIEVFSSFELLGFVIGAVDVVDVPVSEFVPSPPGEHLACSGIV